MNMSLIWILQGLRQPNYPYLPSDLSHMGSYQRMDLWLICCTHATYAFGKMMDSSKFAFENWWLKQIMLSKFGGLKQIMLSNMNGLKQTSFRKLMDSSKLCFRTWMDSSKLAFKIDGLKQSMLSRINGPKQIMLCKLMDSESFRLWILWRTFYLVNTWVSKC